MSTNDLNRSSSWGETLLSLGPVLFLTMLYTLFLILAPFAGYLNQPGFGIAFILVMAGLVLVALLAGWVKDFPRWVFPYWGFAVLVSLYFQSFTGTVSGQPFNGDLRVWIPLGVVALAGLLWRRSLDPLFALVKSIWKDWTLLSFAFYGALPLLFFAAYDETHNEESMRILITLLLAAGAVFYMRLENPWHRFAALVGGFSISWLALMVHLGWYWNGRQEYWMPEPGSWIETLEWTSRFGAMQMLMLVAPVLVELLRRTLAAPGTQQPPISRENAS